MKRTILFLALILTLSSGITVNAQDNALAEEGFVSLFNGTDLSGWKIRGGDATYSVEDGAIVGKCAPGKPHNTFLCSEKEYANFILRLEFKFIEGGNSGVQFRSNAQPMGTDRERVFGYQCELEPGGGVTGRIYDEGRRGFNHGYTWLDIYTPKERIDAAVKVYKAYEWNTLEIQCVGPSLRTWINGNPIANICDSYDLKGFIGLQVHAGQSGTIAWKNIRIKDLGESQWKSFFVKGEEGTKLVDARFVLPTEWSFNEDEGFLHGQHKKAERRDGLVVSDNNYNDFMVRVTYRINGGNSALYFRAEEVNTPWLLKGFQNEIAGGNVDSALWHTAGDKTPGRGWVARNDEMIDKVRKAEGWNTTCTIAIGDRLVQTLNGFCTSDIIDPLCEKTGKVGLQMHGSTDCEMFFKDFDILLITPEQRALIERP